MERAERRIRALAAVRWLAPVPALIIYIAVNGIFPDWATMVLAVGFMFGFSHICNSERKRILCDDIIKDIRTALNEAGHREAVFEVKPMKIGIVVRVYLIRARQKSAECSRVIVHSISIGWYKPYVFATQIVDLDSASDVKEAQLVLNEDLIADIKEKTSKEKGKKD